MAAAFNPYHKWLGIPPEEQPAHHYRLLGIKVFETDADVIESAADQRMAHLRTLGSGKNAELSQKLLNEISAAKVALLNPEKRAAYDQQLRQALAAKAAPAKIPKAVPLAPAPVVIPNLSTRSPQRKPAVSPALLAAIGGGVALLLLVGVLVALNSGSDRKTVADNPAPSPTPTPNLNPTLNLNPAPPSPPPAPSPEPTTNSEPAAPDSPTPSPTPVTPSPETSSVTPPLATANSRTVVTPLAAPLAPALGTPIDLLARISAAEHAVRGKWAFDGMVLVDKGTGSESVLEIPFIPPAEYDLKIEVERKGPYSLGLGLLADGRPFPLRLDGRPGGDNTQYSSGLRLDGKWYWDWEDPTTFRGQILPPNTPITLVFNVREDRLRMQAGPELIFDCALNPQQSQPFADWKTTNPQHMNLASNRTQFRFSKLELIPLGAAESVATASDAAPAKPVDTRPVPPDEAQQAEIRKSLNEIYKLSARRTPAEKRQLAGELMTLADDTRDKPAERYVFLREVQRLATDTGDFDLAHRAVEAQGEFAIDALLESGRLLIALATSAKDDVMLGKLADLVPPWVERALRDERYVEADKLLDAAARALAKPAGRKFAKPIVDLRAEVAAQAKQRIRLQAAREKLATDPANPEANLALGSWLCFTQGNWNAGLPHLAQGSHAALQACAAKELAGQPKTADEQIALGDAWWDLAQQTAGDEKAGPLARADHWYRIASAGSVAGLTKAKLDNRLEETQKARAASSNNLKSQPAAKGSRVLIVMANQDESNQAQQACQRYGMPCNAVRSFDREQVDYSAYHTILCGSNDMNYWGKSDANKDPAAFQHIERFVNQGGHLIVCGTFNGVNMEHLKRFGIYTGFVHNSKFAPAGAATDLLFDGVKDLVPADQHLQSAGHFNCYRQHVVLLNRGSGPKDDCPALTTSRHGKGRLTFTLCEPHWRGDMWLIPVLLHWVSRGAPTP